MRDVPAMSGACGAGDRFGADWQSLRPAAEASGLVAVHSVLAAGALLIGSASAQEVLPAAAVPFKGQIGLSAKDSKPDFPQPVHAPKGAAKHRPDTSR
jgi:hypothetical protein